MNSPLKLLFLFCVLCSAGKHGRDGHSFSGLGFSAPNAAMRELAKGAFINSWPVTNKPELQHLKTESLKDANFHDTDDCAKKLLCQLAKKEGLEWDEELLINYYDEPVNYGADSLFFNIAVKVGKDGERECFEVYPRCYLDLHEMLKILRRQGISFEIPGEERDCQVYFLWKKKDKRGAASKKLKEMLNNETETSAENIVFEDESTENPETEEK